MGFPLKPASKIVILGMLSMPFLSAHAAPKDDESNQIFKYGTALTEQATRTVQYDNKLFENIPSELYLDIVGDRVAQALNTPDDLKQFFDDNIILFTSETPSECLEEACDPPSMDFLLGITEVYLTKNKKGESSTFLSKKRLISERDATGIIKINPVTSATSQLGAEASSLLRISTYISAAYATSLANQGKSGIQYCETVTLTPYLCDSEKLKGPGPLQMAGELLYRFTRACSSCNDVDKGILNMIDTHYLLRSNNKAVRRQGEAIYREKEKEFKSIGLGGTTLNEIYIKSLTQ